MLRRRARTLELGGADRLHLHSLLWGRVARRWFSKAPATTQNAAVFPMILLFAAIPAALAVTFRTSTPLLIASFVFCALLYALIYARLVHFHWTRPRLRPAQKSTISRRDDQ